MERNDYDYTNTDKSLNNRVCWTKVMFAETWMKNFLDDTYLLVVWYTLVKSKESTKIYLILVLI